MYSSSLELVGCSNFPNTVLAGQGKDNPYFKILLSVDSYIPTHDKSQKDLNNLEVLL